VRALYEPLVLLVTAQTDGNGDGLHRGPRAALFSTSDVRE
jgi:hypothetical protein